MTTAVGKCGQVVGKPNGGGQRGLSLSTVVETGLHMAGPYAPRDPCVVAHSRCTHKPLNRLAEPKKQALNAINKTLLKKHEGAALKLPRSPRGRGAG